MTGYGSRRFAVALSGTQTSIQPDHVLVRPLVLMRHNYIGCFHKSPLQEVIRRARRRPLPELAPLACTVGTSPA